MAYYPKSQVKTDLYTNGGQYVLSTTQEEYTGYYYEISTGQKYTGKNPQQGPSILLQKLRNYINDVKNTWGGALGFNFEKELPKIILGQIFYQSLIGSFNNGTSTRDGFVAARHDQSVNSVIFHNHKIDILDYGFIAAKIHLNTNTYIQYGD
jgi:hypothetical protein